VKIRVVELPSKEVFIDVNDLLIALLLKIEKTNSEVERKVIKDIIAGLTVIRDGAHK
jgi:hypothetical protein